jgi:hypothetical protein
LLASSFSVEKLRLRRGDDRVARTHAGRHEATGAESRARGRIEARRGATLHALLHDAEAIGELRSEDSDLEHVSLPGSDVPKLRRPAIRPLTPVKRLRIAPIRLIAIDAGAQGEPTMSKPRAACIALVLSACAWVTDSDAQGSSAQQGGWREFEGSWTAAGSVRTLALGGTREATLADLHGSLLLAGPSRPGIGFRGDAIALSDNLTGMVGRAVWTDERGHQIFSELRGAGPARGGHVTGTFVGGTGRYAGATGSYEFTWQYVMTGEDGVVQGRAVGLKGRVRSDVAAP